MTEVECSHMEDFVNTGRTGRRNALADIQEDQNSAVSTAPITFDMDKLSCHDSSSSQTKPQQEEPPGASGQGQGS
ncbi:cAMP-dependent protein kinase inhibitor gamma-like isoform X2 [Argopecten irradians]